MLLIHPPLVKPGEPPPGIARLLGALRSAGVPATAVDLNLETILTAMNRTGSASDRWTLRAVKNLPRNLSRIRSPETYHHPDRYRRAVMDLDRLLCVSGLSDGVHLSLSNFQHPQRSPVRSADLLDAAENPERNPFFPFFRERLTQLLEERQPTVLGISLTFLSQALCAFTLAGLVRRMAPRVRIVLGGGLVTSWLSRPDWRNPFQGLVDDLTAGPGEGPLLAAAGVQGAPAQAPLPDYSFARHAPYLSPGFILPYSSAGGCYWNRCSFCPERAEGNPYRPIPEPLALRQVQQLAADYRPVLLHLLDNAVRPRLLEAFVESPPGLPWYGFARISDCLADPGFCLDLKKAGCTLLKLGLESGDQSVLDAERKGIDLPTAERALHCLGQAGIATYVYLLFGTPSETLDKARKTLEFVVRHASNIGFLNLAIFNLPIHAPEARHLATRSHYDGDLSLYADFVHPLGWHRGLVRRFLDREFKRHPVVSPILRRDPPYFTSNHAAFFVDG